MVCFDLLSTETRKDSTIRTKRAQEVDFSRFSNLHTDGQKLISGWFWKAWNQQREFPQNTFESFIYAWISFNAWASCVTGHDRDTRIIDVLLLSKALQDDFLALVNSPISDLYKSVPAFAKIWPIFKAQDIRRKPIKVHPKQSRQDIITTYFNAGIDHYQPQCARIHFKAKEQIPLDWPHTLKALYRVRCNLFHGEKSIHSENDKRVVSSAFSVLILFMRESRYMFGEEDWEDE